MKFCWFFFSVTLNTQFRFSYTCNIYIYYWTIITSLYIVYTGLSLRAQGSVIFPATISMNPTILTTLSWDTPCCTHIPTKSCAPSIPVLIFLLLTCPLAKTNIDGAENTTSVPTNVMSIVASSTHRKQKDNRTQKNFLTSQFPTYIFVRNCIYLTIWNLSDRSVSNLPLIDWLIDWLTDLGKPKNEST